jgi:hypothetical protein
MVSEDEKSGEGTPPADEIKNIKAEMSRKLSNTESTLAALKASQDALLAQIATLAPKPALAPEQKLSDLMYSDPEAYAQKVLAEAEKRADARLEQRLSAQSAQQNVIAELVNQFPELSDGDHEFTKSAVAKFNAMPAEDRKSPVAYKTAVMEAALEAGVKPKSKRERVEGDEYVGRGSSGSASRSKKSAEIDPRTVAFAELVGLDISKPEVKERLKSNHGRESYLKWK